MPDHALPTLPLSRESMSDVARRALADVRRLGASDAEVEVSAAVGQSVTVRHGEVGTGENNRDKGLTLPAYIGRRRGPASTSDLSPEATDPPAGARGAIARHPRGDDCRALP